MVMESATSATSMVVLVVMMDLVMVVTCLQVKPLDRLEAILSTQDWLLGDEFSVADVAVASYLLYVPQVRRRNQLLSVMSSGICHGGLFLLCSHDAGLFSSPPSALYFSSGAFPDA